MQVFLTLICYGTKNIRWFLRSFEGFKTFIDALLRDRTQRQNFYSKQIPKKKSMFYIYAPYKFHLQYLKKCCED